MASQTLAASKRLRKELQVLRKSQNDKDDDIFLQNNPDNLLLWKAWIRGPSDTPYEGGVFQLDIRCGMDYPLSPPTIKFVTKMGFVFRRFEMIAPLRLWFFTASSHQFRLLSGR